METITGEDIGLSLVAHIGTLSSNSAQRAQTWHKHNGFELLFVLSGATSWEFQGAPKVTVSGGQYLVVPPGVMHRVEHGMRSPSDVCGVLFLPKARQGQKCSIFTKENLRWLNDCFTKAAFKMSSSSRELLSRVSRLVEIKHDFDLDLQNPLIKATIRSLSCSVILEAACGLAATAPEGPSALVSAAKQYLSEHLSEPVSMSNLVRHMGFSRSHLFAIFKSATGMTPNDYYLRLRIERAYDLLCSTTRTITEIALDTGFSSSQYFSSVFRKYTGQSPMECRREPGAHCLLWEVEIGNSHTS